MVSRLESTVIFLNHLKSILAVPGLPRGVFDNSTLNPFAALSPSVLQAVRSSLADLLSSGAASLPDIAVAPVNQCTFHLPFHTTDFIDFSSSIHHNLSASLGVTGRSTLPPALKVHPVGYVSRSAGLVVSGTDIERPVGAVRADGENIEVRKCEKLDYEGEVGVFVGQEVPRGTRLGKGDGGEMVADGHGIEPFGLVLLNDWSGMLSITSIIPSTILLPQTLTPHIPFVGIS